MDMLVEYIVKLYYCMECPYFRMNSFVPAINLTIN